MQTGEPLATDADIPVFKTPWRSRALSLAGTILAALLWVGLPLFVVPIIGLAAQGFDVVWFFMSACVMVIWIILSCVLWKMVAGMSRFRITIGKEAVEVGGWWGKRAFAYDTIGLIALPRDKEQFGVTIEDEKRRKFVPLQPDDEARCASILRERCVNAIFVDHSGREVLPEGVQQPMLAANALYRRYRSLAGLGFFTVLAASIPGVASGVKLWEQFAAWRLGLNAPDLVLYGKLFGSCLVVAIFGSRSGFVRLRQMRAVQAAIANSQTSGPSADNG
jgi:hypothetical protein